MPPKKPTSNAPPASRRSARIADQPTKVNSKALDQDQANGNGNSKGKSVTTSAKVKTNGNDAEVTAAETKKRSAKEPAVEDSEAKKRKTATIDKSDKSDQPKSKPKQVTSKKQSSSSAATKKEKEKEAEAEAPADAPAETGPRGQLKQGDKLPKITLKDNGGNEVDVSTIAGEKGVVIFLYPKADTPGCTTQACGYRENFDKISEYGYDIYGLSKDKPEAQQKWITKKELTYKLLCDPESKLIKRLGAFVAPNNTKRSHFIFEKGSGKLVDIALGVKPADDPTNVLKFLEQHHS
ncbi:hypothetical protein IAT40_005368 [Kwoniella sp. CBS 6097]